MKTLLSIAVVLVSSVASAQDWSGTSQQIGSTTFYNFDNGVTGTASRIGQNTYYNFDVPNRLRQPQYVPPYVYAEQLRLQRQQAIIQQQIFGSYRNLYQPPAWVPVPGYMQHLIPR